MPCGGPLPRELRPVLTPDRVRAFMTTHSDLRQRISIMAVFAAFGSAIGTIAGAMPVVLANAGVGSFAFGVGLTLSTLLTVTIMSLGGTIARFTSNRTVLLWSLPAFAALVSLLLVSPSPVWFFAAFLLVGIVFGFTDLFMNAEAAAVEHDLGRPVFTAFHGCVSVAVAGFAILQSYVAVKVGLRVAALPMIAMFGLAWWMVYLFIAPRQLARGRAARMFTLPNKLPLTLLGVAAGLIIAGETAALMWSAKLLDELAPSLAAIAGLGAAFFGICNAAVRFPGDRLRARFGDLPLMVVSLVIAICGFLVLGVSGSFAVSAAAFAAVGLGTAVLIPCIFALAARFVPANRAGGLGFVSLLAGVPRTLAPWVFGWVAADVGIGASFVLVGLAQVAALGLVLVMMRLK
jgi:hypothetical protein